MVTRDFGIGHVGQIDTCKECLVDGETTYGAIRDACTARTVCVGEPPHAQPPGAVVQRHHPQVLWVRRPRCIAKKTSWDPWWTWPPTRTVSLLAQHALVCPQQFYCVLTLSCTQQPCALVLVTAPPRPLPGRPAAGRRWPPPRRVLRPAPRRPPRRWWAGGAATAA